MLAVCPLPPSGGIMLKEARRASGALDVDDGDKANSRTATGRSMGRTNLALRPRWQ